MFTIRTAVRTTTKGVVITAKGHGRQRTIAYDPNKSVSFNHGAAAGTLLNLLTTPEQQAKVRHPSGGQRVTVATFNDQTGKTTINV